MSRSFKVCRQTSLLALAPACLVIGLHHVVMEAQEQEAASILLTGCKKTLGQVVSGCSISDLQCINIFQYQIEHRTTDETKEKKRLVKLCRAIDCAMASLAARSSLGRPTLMTATSATVAIRIIIILMLLIPCLCGKLGNCEYSAGTLGSSPLPEWPFCIWDCGCAGGTSPYGISSY